MQCQGRFGARRAGRCQRRGDNCSKFVSSELSSLAQAGREGRKERDLKMTVTGRAKVTAEFRPGKTDLLCSPLSWLPLIKAFIKLSSFKYVLKPFAELLYSHIYLPAIFAKVTESTGNLMNAFGGLWSAPQMTTSPEPVAVLQSWAACGVV